MVDLYYCIHPPPPLAVCTVYYLNICVVFMLFGCGCVRMLYFLCGFMYDLLCVSCLFLCVYVSVCVLVCICVCMLVCFYILSLCSSSSPFFPPPPFSLYRLSVLWMKNLTPSFLFQRVSVLRQLIHCGSCRHTLSSSLSLSLSAFLPFSLFFSLPLFLSFFLFYCYFYFRCVVSNIFKYIYFWRSIQFE